jgi:hypothetical protein
MDAMRSRRVDDFCPARRIVMNGSVGSIKQLLLLDQPALLPFVRTPLTASPSSLYLVSRPPRGDLHGEATSVSGMEAGSVLHGRKEGA